MRDNRAARPERMPCRAPGRRGTLNYVALCRNHYEKNGIGADYIDQLMR